MTSGPTPADRGPMTGSTPDSLARGPFRTALACGIVGLIANVLLVGFFALDYSAARETPWGWLGFANDLVGTVEFALFIPVIAAVARLLPAGHAMKAITGLALVATAGLVVVSLALVVGAMTFEVQVRYVMGFLVVLYGWLLAVSSVGHRANALPRPVTRFGLLLGVSWPAALLLTLAGLLIGGVDLSAQQFGMPGVLLVIPAVILGFINWLALPVWPLLVAATVFRARPPVAAVKPATVSENVSKKGDFR